MALKTKIKVGNITSLSEARYCAGMGVDFLGFPLKDIEKDIQQFTGISSWISGPQLVVECQSPNSIDPLLWEQLSVDFIQIDLENLSQLTELGKPLFISMPDELNNEMINCLNARKDSIEYVITSEIGWKGNLNSLRYFKVMIKDSLEDMDWDKIINNGAAGFSLQGRQETSPGIHDYERLSSILDVLELNAE